MGEMAKMCIAGQSGRGPAGGGITKVLLIPKGSTDQDILSVCRLALLLPNTFFSYLKVLSEFPRHHVDPLSGWLRHPVSRKIFSVRPVKVDHLQVFRQQCVH